MARKLGYICYVIFPDGKTVPVDQLTPEQREEWQSNMRERLSERMSDYFTQHPEELRNI